jgi:hypothetical protein
MLLTRSGGRGDQDGRGGHLIPLTALSVLTDLEFK